LFGLVELVFFGMLRLEVVVVVVVCVDEVDGVFSSLLSCGVDNLVEVLDFLRSSCETIGRGLVFVKSLSEWFTK
jgi:hypothetical protein